MPLTVEEIYRNGSPTVRQSLERQGLVSAKSAGHKTQKPKTSEASAPVERRNSTEIAYEAEVLIPAQIRGEIRSWMFEPIKLRLADRTYYSPDYLVVLTNGRMAFHEVKGRPGSGPGGWMDDARVKVKVAAERYGELFGFVGASRLPKKDGGGWKIEVFG